MRSSTKSESNGNNSDNINNNTIDIDEVRDKRLGDDAIEVTSIGQGTELLNQAGNSESELTQRADHNEIEQATKVNVYEQVKYIFHICLSRTRLIS